MAHRIWSGARVLTCTSPQTASEAERLDIRTRDGRITEVGPDLPPGDAEVFACEGRLLTPGLIDCHSHLVHAGHRAGEFFARLEGRPYAQIAAEGGGIAATMRATRAASEAELIALALPRLDGLLADGVTTVEIKSGYGLSVEAELRMLRAARALGGLRPVRVVTTWLAAHALPPEAQGDRAGYLRDVVMAGLRAAHSEGLVDQVDAFCEGIAFSPAEIAPLFALARELGLPVKLHAEQLSASGGAALAAAHGALSADHLEWASAADAEALARAGTVAVLLPGAYYALRETKAPPVAAFRAAGTAIAVATDLNPGTSPLGSLLLAANMACVLFGLTLPEAMLGITAHAARALGLAEVTGRIAPGLAADFALWEAEHPAELIARMGPAPLSQRVLAATPTGA